MPDSGSRPLVIIPARSGSKGIPDKNLRKVGGVTLVGRAVLTAARFVSEARLPQARVFVDTDSPAIAREAEWWGVAVPFLRPAELARDETPTSENVLWALKRLEEVAPAPDAIVLLQPTSPLRTSEDVLQCWRMFDPIARPSIVNVTVATHPVEIAVRMSPDGVLSSLRGSEEPTDSRRQGFVPAYMPSGAVYIITPELLRRHRTFMIPGVSRGVVISRNRDLDVDEAVDLDIAEALLASRQSVPVVLAGRSVGRGAPCFVVAEAGVNHNGDIHLAHQLIDAAAEAGVDAIKFQTFDPELVVSPKARKATYQLTDGGADESQLAMLRRLVLPADAHAALRDHANTKGLMFLSTAFDEASVDFLDTLGVPAFKIPSGEIINHPYLAHVALKKKPILLSTGMSTSREISDALAVLREHGAPEVVLLHCVSSYPAAPSECNLRAMSAMRATFGTPVGFSDHTMGTAISLAAVAQGAEILEKHFTLDRGLTGPDHGASLEPGELVTLVRSIRSIEGAQGDGEKRPMPSERDVAQVARRSLHAAFDLPAGHTIRAADIIALRPAGGLSPVTYRAVIGRRLSRPVLAGDMLHESDLA